MTLEEKVAQLGSRWVGNDMQDAGADVRAGSAGDPQRGADAGRLRGLRGDLAGGGEPARPRPPDPGLRQRAADRRRGRGRADPPAAVVLANSRAGHPGAGARGVPDRVHHLRRHGLPGRDRLGRHLRPRAGRADGRRDRPRHGRPRRAPGPVPGARRGARLPLGPGRGDHRRGPVPGRDARRRLTSAGLQSAGVHRHPQALRRLLGLARRPQPRPGLDGPARAARRHPAALRDRDRAWPGPAR